MQIALVKQSEILESFRKRAISKIPDLFNETNAYIDDEPLPSGENVPEWDFALSFSMADGSFDEQLQDNPCTIQESGDVIVCFMRNIGESDPARLDVNLLHDSTLGMINRVKPLLLSAFLIERSGTSRRRWNPLNQSGLQMLSDAIKVVNCMGPHRHSAWPILYFYLSFRVKWNWEL